MDKIRIVEVYETIWKKNPISGHEWREDGKFLHYQVSGGGFFATKHKTIESAEKEVELRQALVKKFPNLLLQ